MLYMRSCRLCICFHFVGNFGGDRKRVSLIFPINLLQCEIYRYYLLISLYPSFFVLNADSYQSATSGVPTDNDPNNTTVGYMLLLYVSHWVIF